MGVLSCQSQHPVIFLLWIMQNVIINVWFYQTKINVVFIWILFLRMNVCLSIHSKWSKHSKCFKKYHHWESSYITDKNMCTHVPKQHFWSTVYFVPILCISRRVFQDWNCVTLDVYPWNSICPAKDNLSDTNGTPNTTFWTPDCYLPGKKAGSLNLHHNYALCKVFPDR